ncbi:stage IV sporulation protein A [Ruminococcus sp. FC2018]|uniref:stage IV sporulation protein A n=1 Tax=Ruminococcus sp. FC2018 TaxID=1410617 RepID=UPI0004910067|nr:stage IV sporulation protein A [Ruminococcus sp. FC2018]
MAHDIYSDIAARTGGDIYIGVVGPVRTGKSTFINRFMEQFVIPNIESDFRKERAIDELPQSSAGKTIMTTEPKFIPEEAVRVNIEGGASFNVRMIDCVGYIIPSAIGYIENDAPRMVDTPWFDDPVPFNMAAEVGTEKVITQHSTIGLVVTTDGSITDLPRDEYEECEQRVINELKGINKPFVVLMNSTDPDSKSVKELCDELSQRYEAPVMPVSCIDLDEDDIRKILTQILYSFPVREINISMPSWINSLKKGHWLKDSVFGHIKTAAFGVKNLRDVNSLSDELEGCEYITASKVTEIDLGNGSANVKADLEPSLFFKIIGEVTGLEVSDENQLMDSIFELVKVRKRFEKFSDALDEMEATGYGIVMPTMDEMTLAEPEILKQGTKYGIRLKASAPAVHLLKTSINTEVAPIVGSEKQSEELVLYMLNDFEDSPDKIWSSNIFGKSLHELVNEGLHAKMSKLPSDARNRLRETIERMINEGCSGLICFIL